MKVYGVGMLAGLVGLLAAIISLRSSVTQQFDIFGVDIKRLAYRVESLEHKPVLFNANVKVGDEVCIFNRQYRGKVLAVDNGKIWVSCQGRQPETRAADELALVKNVVE